MGIVQLITSAFRIHKTGHLCRNVKTQRQISEDLHKRHLSNLQVRIFALFEKNARLIATLTANVSNSLFLLEPCPIAAYLAKQWLQRLSRQQIVFEYFSTSSRDSFLSWCSIKASADAGYGSDSSDSDVLSYSSNSSVALSSRPLTSRSMLSSKASESILTSSLLERPKTAVARLLHSSLSGRRAIKSASRRFEVPVRARTADGYIHGIRSAMGATQTLNLLTAQEDKDANEDRLIEVEKISTQNQPLTVDQFLDSRKKSAISVQLQDDDMSENENAQGLHAEGIRDMNTPSIAIRGATSRWDDASHEAAIAHPSNYDWMDRNVRFAIVGNNGEFSIEREILKRDCIPRMREEMRQLGYTLEMVGTTCCCRLLKNI
jgi:hypothetical protein